MTNLNDKFKQQISQLEYGKQFKDETYNYNKHN